MSKYYRGFWSFAPLPEMTTYVVEANTEDEAIEMLGTWAYAHQNYVDEPWDFEVEELDSTRWELAQKIVAYDIHYSEYDGSVFDVYEETKNTKALAEMAHNYVGDLKYQQEIVNDFQSFPPWERAVSENATKEIITILRLIREITTKEVA